MMEIKSTIIYDYDTIKKSLRFHMNKDKKLTKALIIYLSLIAIYNSFILFADGYNDSVISILCFILIILSLYLFTLFFNAKLSYKNSNPYLRNITNTYIFGDNELFIESENENYRGKSRIVYKALINVYETNEFFYLYKEKAQMYIVSKNNIENGTALDIRNFLVSKLPGRYYLRLENKKNQ